MARPMTTLTLHLPAYRARALRLASEAREAEATYDANIGAYLDYLRAKAAEAGFTIGTDQRDDGPTYSIDADDAAAKKAAHAWLETLPDLWNWMP